MYIIKTNERQKYMGNHTILRFRPEGAWFLMLNIQFQGYFDVT